MNTATNHAQANAKLLFLLSEMANVLWWMAAIFTLYGGMYGFAAAIIHPSFAQVAMARKLRLEQSGKLAGTNRNYRRKALISLIFLVTNPPTGAATPHPPSKAQPQNRRRAHNVPHKFWGIFHFLNVKAAI